MVGRPSWRAGYGWEALTEGRQWSEDPLEGQEAYPEGGSGREDLPEGREWSEDKPGQMRVVGRPSLRTRSGREDITEGH